MRTTYLKNRVLLKWYGDEIYKQIAGMKEQDEALASVRMQRDVMRYAPVGSYKRSARSAYVNAKGKLISMKAWQQRTPGRLKSSIFRSRSRYKGGGFIIMAGNYYAWYSRIVEYGTKMRRQKTTGRFTGRAKAVRYMRRSLRDERRRFIQDMKRSLTMLRGMNE